MLGALRIATLNARGIDKVTNRSASSSLHKYLGSLRLDILVLQETNIDPRNSDQLLYLNNSLHVYHAIWTSHCAFLLINPKLTFSSSYVLLDQRAIVASIGTVDKDDETIFDICALYAPSGDRGARFSFNNLLQLEFFLRPSTDFVLLGDFNYHHHLRHTAPARWKEWINTNAVNVMTPHNTLPIHTFNNQHHQSTIDYIFMSPSLAALTTAPTATYMSRSWTDHTLLSCEIKLGQLQTGPGVWRMNVSILGDLCGVDDGDVVAG
ncbi:Endonuclease/exonuclease/phosphatase [Mortierella sp. GBAus27b]|nr:Endonuclease/exonuclease/phosphatase [Mortierella sp. GBAus27b]